MISVIEFNKPAKEVSVHENVDWRKFEMQPDHLYWWDLFNLTDDETSHPERKISFSSACHRRLHRRCSLPEGGLLRKLFVSGDAWS